MSGQDVEEIRQLVAQRKRWDKVFAILGLLSMMVGVVTLLALIIDMGIDGTERLSWDFFTSYPSRHPERAGILSPWVGTALVILVTAAAAIPLGVMAGIYLEEYAPRNWLTNLIEINVTNLAAVPSIVYGLLALGLFVYQLDFGQSILSAGLTLALMILPVVIVATREAIRGIPAAIQLGLPSSSSVLGKRGGGRRRVAHHDPRHERLGHLAAVSLPQAHPVVESRAQA